SEAESGSESASAQAVTELRASLAQAPRIEGALISLEAKTGAIQALAGGYSFNQSKYNRATQASRQPGSTFKPFLYLSALENGRTPATIYNDAPIVFEDSELETAWRPQNSSGQFYGPTTL
ncbi:MAG TPA: peptidase, partial [Marinobacter hydrocarbonoclasticus]|nr:peptidase [Marinobacter nauticus]